MINRPWFVRLPLIWLFSVALVVPVAASEEANEEVSQTNSATATQTIANSPLAAKPANTPATSVGVSPIVDSGYVLQFLLALGLVIAGIFGLMHLLRKLNQLPGKGSAAMRIIGGIPLGAREKLVLVQVGEAQLLLGMAPGQLRTLHVFDEPVIDPNEQAATNSGFAAVLNNLSGKKHLPKTDDTGTSS